ncbi:MAG: BamA/TamA family outer membrane protein [Woeseiaceae bacterium]
MIDESANLTRLRSTRWLCALLSLLFVTLFVSPVVHAQTKEDVRDEIDELRNDFELMRHDSLLVPGLESLGVENVQMEDGWLKKFASKWPKDLVIAPVPGYSPQLGWNLKLAAGYFKDPASPASQSPPSVFGGVLMIAENGSSAFAGGTYLHLLDDRLRIQLGAGYADVKYRYYLNDVIDGDTDLSLDIEQSGPLYFTKGTWRIWRRMYLGLGYVAGTVETGLRRPGDLLPGLPPDLLPTLKLDLGAIIVPLEIDSRDNNQFPREGWKIDGDAKFYRESAGSDFDADIFKLSINHYLPVRDTDALATRVIFKSSGDGAPFFLKSAFGGSTDLRGYESGRYRDNKMYSIQTEYRWQFNDRWIFTGFAGFGEVADTFSDFGSDLLPATGIGARFVLSKKHKVSLSSDVAVGNDGVEFYFGVGEAF